MDSTGKPKVEPSVRTVPQLPPPGQRLRVIIDSDAATEIDDLYAIALALLAPERLEIEGFVGAHYGDSGGREGIGKSVAAIETIMDKAGLAGKFPVKPASHPFRYSRVPEESEGVDFIIERAMASDPSNPLWVVSLGPATTLASAWLKQPAIKDRMVAFWHGRTRWPEQAWNYNAYNDVKAVRILFASDLPFVLFDTGTRLVCPMEESAQKIAPQGPLGQFLHEYRYRREWFQSPDKGFFDLGDIAALVDPSCIKSEVVPAPGIEWDMTYLHDKPHGQLLRIHDIDRDRAFDLFYRKLAEAWP